MAIYIAFISTMQITMRAVCCRSYKQTNERFTLFLENITCFELIDVGPLLAYLLFSAKLFAFYAPQYFLDTVSCMFMSGLVAVKWTQEFWIHVKFSHENIRRISWSQNSKKRQLTQ